jgi:hypothetical protein
MAPVSESDLLLTNGPEHISGQENSKGRFNYQECRRLIQLFLELKCEPVPVAEPFRLLVTNSTVIIAVSAEPECENAANGAVIWHLSRVMHDIDVHCKQREYASKLRAEPFAGPSKILDGLLSCMSFGVHIVYRERLHRAHPASHASLADFRTFVQANLVEWSGKALNYPMAPELLFTLFL